MDKKQIVHAVAIGSVLVLNLQSTVYAADACVNGTASAIASNATGFVKNTFTPKCSNNVTVNYAETATDFFVKGASAKGMHTYGGSTIGGGVMVCESTSVSNPAASLSAGTAATGTVPAGC